MTKKNGGVVEIMDMSILIEFAVKFGLPAAVCIWLIFHILKRSEANEAAAREHTKLMYEDSKEREKVLMQHVEVLGDTQQKIASTLDKIEERMNKTEGRIEKIEDSLEFMKLGAR